MSFLILIGFAIYNASIPREQDEEDEEEQK